MRKKQQRKKTRSSNNSNIATNMQKKVTRSGGVIKEESLREMRREVRWMDEEKEVGGGIAGWSSFLVGGNLACF